MTSMDLNLYNDFGHIILTFPITDLSYKTLSLIDSVDLKSLVVIELNSDNDINPVAYNIIPATSSFKKGDNIVVSENIGLYQKNISGKIIEINDKYIDIIHTKNQHPQIFRIKDATQLVSDTLPGSNYITIYPSTVGSNLQLSYIFQNISWKTNYTLILDDKNKNNIKLFKSTAQITNETDSSWNINRLKLICGQPNPPSQHNYRSLNAQVSLNASISQPELISVDEYEAYEFNSINLGKETYINLFMVKDVPCQRYYQHIIGGDRTTFGLKVSAFRFLSEGQVSIYTQSDIGIGSYLGNNKIKESQINDDVDVEIGSTSQVKCESVIERKTEQLKEAVNKDQTLYTIRETYNIKVKINNRGNEYRYMILVLDIGTSKIESIVFKGFKFDQVVKGGKIKWIFMNNGDREIGIEVVVIN
jgi:hypothetical protein